MRNIMIFLRLRDVMTQTGLSLSSIYKFMDERAFPKIIPLTAGTVTWLESEVLVWIEEDMA
jgi:prophage regulatory protein